MAFYQSPLLSNFARQGEFSSDYQRKEQKDLEVIHENRNFAGDKQHRLKWRRLVATHLLKSIVHKREK